MRRTVLVVDDQQQNRELMAAYLQAVDCDVVTAADGHRALHAVEQSRPDIVLLDIMMPGIDGFEVCRRIKVHNQLLPVVLVSALSQAGDRVLGLEAGADDFITKPVEKIELVARVRSLLRLKALYDRLDGAERVMMSLARAVEAKDHYTETHTERVAHSARLLGRAAGVGESALGDLFLGAVIHDIGKIGIPDSVLLKAGPLTSSERDLMRNHVVIGSEIVAPLRSAAAVTPVIRHHHEHFDGRGYPDGLAGDRIPIAARIVAVCDSWDAMTSARPYRRALSPAQAESVLRIGAGTQWDPTLVSIFLSQVLAAQSEVA